MMNYSDQSEKASELIQSEGKKFMEALPWKTSGMHSIEKTAGVKP